MTAQQFKFHYLSSLLITIIGAVGIVGAVFFFTVSVINTSIELLNSVENNPEYLTNQLFEWIKHSMLAITSFFVIVIGIIWNITSAFLRSLNQNNMKLFWVVALGWASSIFLPFIGIFISAITQVYGWILGKKDDKPIIQTSKILD